MDVKGTYISKSAATQRRNTLLLRLLQNYSNLHLSFSLGIDAPTSTTNLGGFDAPTVELLKSTVNAGVRIDTINLLTMEYYVTVRGNTQGGLAISAAIACATRAVDQLATSYPAKNASEQYNMLGSTPMIGVNDDHKVFRLADAQQVTTFVKQKGIGFFSY